ncbi:multifunctional CCA addition/repair protein [Candidatus Pantoea edessiphila]|uniref:Multifunctional CCA protein n=1 Tax=Candidatus Pantoea edessiphila TaxID=2044610 RepID=A0A2P5SVU8_9GAMM|nr:multifunctional CCA addition/repair protein [Candidatus Pantoea edessiphila]PPI86457.1 multifunctional CCA addition/repair protein [Candidatus Pantoea edessiphila]
MKIFLVGGAVRDRLLDLPIQDKDWVVVGATPEMMIKKGYHQVGNDFPVFINPQNGEEYSLARTERKIGKGYSGFVTWSTPDITLEQDLKRRDLTINAIACDDQGKLVDPYNGQNDIINRKLRHVSSAFNEDPLRVLRVARFAASFAHLNFQIAHDTKKLMYQITQDGELSSLTTERIWRETQKALVSKNPQIYFHVLRECGALRILIPEINNLFGIPSPIKWHPEIDTGLHALMSLTISAALSNSVDIRFATLFHDVGKSLTPRNQWPSHHNHGQLGVSLIKSLCKRWPIPNTIRNLSILVTELHDKIHTIENQSIESLVNFFNRIDAWRKPYRVEQMAIISEADARGRAGLENIKYKQGYYLRYTFKLAQSVSSKTIVKEGFEGMKVFEELTKRRIIAIKDGLTVFKIL